MLRVSTIKFLKDLKSNNNREWFQDNKSTFEEAKEDFEAFVSDLLAEISLFDPSISHHQAKDCIFRIYRDIRFSKDKSPYKAHFGAHISGASKKSDIHSKAGYYIHIEPGASILAGGAYLPQGDWLKQIRQEIAYNASALKVVLKGKDFVKYFGSMQGEQLKTAPRDYPKDHAQIELLRHKSFLASHSLPDKMLSDKGLLDHAATVFKALKPFDDFLNNAQK